MEKLEEAKKKKYTLDFLIPVILMLAMIIVVFAQVVFRVAGHALSWPEEVARWLLIWITFSGSSYAFKNGAMIRVDLFARKLFKENKLKVEIVDTVGLVLTAMFFLLLGAAAIAYALQSIKKGQIYPITQVPIAYTIVSILVGSAMAAYYCLTTVIAQAKDIKSRRLAAPSETKEAEEN